MRIDINHSFFPSQEITDSKWFAGRAEQIERALKVLCDDGTSMLIYGDRGVGKSSFVEMIKQIASGNAELIYRLKLHNKYNPKNFNYKVIELNCDEETDSTAKVLQRLITSPRGIRRLVSAKIEKTETLEKNGLGFSLNFFKADLSNEEKVVKSAFGESSIYETFTNLIHQIQDEILEENEGLLIVIDEFDRVKDTSKMGSLIKNLSKGKVKFVISGIASSYIELLKDHQSAFRQLVQGRIEINPMTVLEVDNIFDLVEENTNRSLNFNRGFRDEVFNLSQGYPYYIQMCGQVSLDYFTKINNDQRGTINSKMLEKGLESLMEYEPMLDDLYHEVVGDSKEKEIILRGSAKMIPKKITRAAVIAYGMNREIHNTKQIITTLLAFRGNNSLRDEVRVLEPLGNDYIFFSDTLFKIFCKVRKPLLLTE